MIFSLRYEETIKWNHDCIADSNGEVINSECFSFFNHHHFFLKIWRSPLTFRFSTAFRHCCVLKSLSSGQRRLLQSLCSSLRPSQPTLGFAHLRNRRWTPVPQLLCRWCGMIDWLIDWLLDWPFIRDRGIQYSIRNAFPFCTFNSIDLSANWPQ